MQCTRPQAGSHVAFTEPSVWHDRLQQSGGFGCLLEPLVLVLCGKRGRGDLRFQCASTAWTRPRPPVAFSSFPTVSTRQATSFPTVGSLIALSRQLMACARNKKAPTAASFLSLGAPDPVHLHLHVHCVERAHAPELPPSLVRG